MKNILYKRSTIRTPEIIFNPESNLFIMQGKSLPEDADRFYKPYKNWLKEYFSNDVEECFFILDFVYFNSSSTKIIFDLLTIVKEAIQRGNKINVVWRYEEDDEELMNAGKEIQEFINIPMRIECKKLEEA